MSIYLDCLRDDSYTPNKILVKAGTHLYDLVDVRYREFAEPQGWVHFALEKADPGAAEEAESHESAPLAPIHVFLLQICVLGNHLNGKDTHIRALKVFGPAASPNESHVDALLQRSMRTNAFRSQAARVGHDAAVQQLKRFPDRDTDHTRQSAVVSPLTHTLR